MAYVELTCTNPGTQNARKNGRVRVYYNAGSGTVSVTKVTGFRTDGYDTNSWGKSNQYVEIVVGGKSSGQMQCSNIYFGKNYNEQEWSSLTPYFSGLSGSSAITVTLTGSDLGTNLRGSIWGNASIDAGYATPSAGSVYSKNVSRTSATLYASGYDLKGLPLTGGGWDVSTNGGTTWTYYGGSPLGDKTINSLSPNTTYHFRNYVTTDGGEANSSWNSFTTSGNAPTATSLQISNITRTSATVVIHGTYDTNASWGGWECVYGTSTAYGSSTDGTITGLSPNTTYYVRGRFKDNWGRWSNYVTTSFKTTGNAPTITSHGVSSHGQTDMQMYYTATYDTNSGFSSMRWDYTTGDLPSGATDPTAYNTNTITGLKPNTTYKYRLVLVENQSYLVAYATGTFKTDYETQYVSNVTIKSVTETSLEFVVSVLNPNWLTNMTVWVFEGDTQKGVQTITSGIKKDNTFLFENLEPGVEYIIKAQITTYAQDTSNPGYLSSIYQVSTSTAEASNVHVMRSDGTDKTYKMYVMGRGNIYNPDRMGWQNGYYDIAIPGSSIDTILTQPIGATESAAASTTWIEIIPNIPYTIKNEDEVDFIIHGTDVNNNITSAGYVVSPGSTYEFTGTTDTTRMWISIHSTTIDTINYATAKTFKMSIFKTVEKTLIPTDNIVYINGKIRYIDIIQAGNTKNDNSHIVELEVYDDNNTNIALGKSASVIKGKDFERLEVITDGKIGEGWQDYADIKPENTTDLETIVRVDLGKDYTNIDHVTLWRYYGDNRVYHNTKIYGRDSTTRLTWKFQSYKIQGEYAETVDGASFTIDYDSIIGVPIINGVIQEPTNDIYTITGTNIIINADWLMTLPPVLDSWVSHRTDAILAARRGYLLKQDIGDLSELSTTAKGSIVEAINEIYETYKGSKTYNSVLNALLNAVLVK